VKDITITEIKKLGKEKSKKNLKKLIDLYQDTKKVELKREIVSSIGRQNKTDIETVYKFIKDNVFKKNYMDVIYQFYRTILYNYSDFRFMKLGEKVEKFYDNEVIYKMKKYKLEKKIKKNKKNKIIKKATLLEGDSKKTLKKIKDDSIQLVFTSPPYYNAKEYSDYNSYKNYLEELKNIFLECCRILEEGRFIIVNVSPIITKRPGREFESMRYPIHFDLHNILTECGFYFIDEIIWIKPEPSVPNRNGGFIQTRKPLSYKPNCITESLLVYRKECNFLLDKNIEEYKNFEPDFKEEIYTSNCWYIAPTYKKEHPAIFPDKLCEKVLKYYSYPSDVVLDPFAGSGTFGKIALKNNRIPILCEKNEEYIDYIKKNIIK
jgi:hypothetical protein